MKKVILGIVAYALFGTMAVAQSPGRDLAALAFASEDSNEDGFVSLGEHQEQAINIFLSMDANDDGLLSWREFFFGGDLEWNLLRMTRSVHRPMKLQEKLCLTFGIAQMTGSLPKKSSCVA